MTSQRRIDTAGLLQLAGAAVGFAAYWALFYAVALHSILAIVPAILIGVSVAGLAMWAQLWSWRRLGGREAVVMTNEWIRAGAVPATVPREVAFPLLYTREVTATKSWWNLVSAVIWIALTVSHFLTAESASADPIWWVGLVVWSGLAAWTIYYNLRWLPVIRMLLRGQPFPDELSTASGRREYTD